MASSPAAQRPRPDTAPTVPAVPPTTSVVDRKGGPLTPAAQRILQVASHLFYTRGIHAVGVDSIAEVAEVTKKTIYDRFGSKDALVTAYLTMRHELYRQWLDEGLARRAADPATQILAVFDLLDEWMRRHNPRGCAFVNAFAELADQDHPGRTVAAEQKNWLRRLFTEQASQAGAAEPGRLADQLLILHEGAVVAFSVSGRTDAAPAARAAATTLIRTELQESAQSGAARSGARTGRH